MIDISTFYTMNVIDTCSIWNILSSLLFYKNAINAKCFFSCTKFVIYECLYKPRKNPTKQDIELQKRLRTEQAKGQFYISHIEIEDLQDIDILRKRKNLSKGELSSMVFAKKTNQAFLTDDQSARKLATQFFMDNPLMVQTTPQLFGWLIYKGFLSDVDVYEVIKEHKYFDRPLSKYFLEVYKKAMEIKLIKF